MQHQQVKTKIKQMIQATEGQNMLQQSKEQGFKDKFKNKTKQMKKTSNLKKTSLGKI